MSFFYKWCLESSVIKILCQTLPRMVKPTHRRPWILHNLLSISKTHSVWSADQMRFFPNMQNVFLILFNSCGYGKVWFQYFFFNWLFQWGNGRYQNHDFRLIGKADLVLNFKCFINPCFGSHFNCLVCRAETNLIFWATNFEINPPCFFAMFCL